MRRILSLWLPAFPIERLLRSLKQAGAPLPYEPGQPFVLVRTGPKGLRLAAIDQAARASGLVIGERLTDARAKVPTLASSLLDEQADLTTLLKLARWAERWSPWIALDPPDGLMLDITGIAHLFGSEDLMCADIRTRFSRLGFTVHTGLAGTQRAAWALARFLLDAPIAAPDGERDALKPLPVEALGLDGQTCHTLRRLGLKTIGQLYDIPRPSLARRFQAMGEKKPARTAGPADTATISDVMLELDQALGIADHPLDPLAHPPVFAVRHALLEPLISAEGVETILMTLSEALCSRLREAGQGALHVAGKLYRSDGSRITLPAGLARPSRDPRHIARLFEFRLDKIDAGFGIDAATLEANETAPLDFTQTSLTPDGPLRDGSALAELADRIANRPDGSVLTALSQVESHVPERAQTPTPLGFSDRQQPVLQPPLLDYGATANADESVSAPVRPITLLERPESVRVIATVPDGPPVRFTWRRIARRVIRAEGPERIAPEWWRSETKSHLRPRDYYIVEDETGRRYWLYREGLYGDPAIPEPQWFIHGLFA